VNVQFVIVEIALKAIANVNLAIAQNVIAAIKIIYTHSKGRFYTAWNR